jgi:hypothetical protein
MTTWWRWRVSGSVVASAASFSTTRVAPVDDAGMAHTSLPSGLENPEDAGAGSLRWQRARLVLDQHQRGTDVGPVGRVLPVRAELAALLPCQGLRRGSTVVVRGSTTVLLALLAQATTEGSWAAVVGMPDLGLLAAAELGVAVSRLALVPRPGAEFGGVVAALLDGLDVVAVATEPPAALCRPAKVAGAQRSRLATLARRLSARARHRESVLVSFGDWPGADLELDCAESTWSGLGNGHGHLVERELTITVRGRGAATRPTSNRITLPAGPSTSTRPGERRTKGALTVAADQATPNKRPSLALAPQTALNDQTQSESANDPSDFAPIQDLDAVEAG